MKKKIDLYLENLYLIKDMFEDDPIALPAIEELIEKAEHCKKRSNIELILTAIIIIFFISSLISIFYYPLSSIPVIVLIVAVILAKIDTSLFPTPTIKNKDLREYVNLALKEKTIYITYYDVIQKGRTLFYINDSNKLELISDEKFGLYNADMIYDKLLDIGGRIYYNEYKEIDFEHSEVRDLKVFGGVDIKEN